MKTNLRKVLLSTATLFLLLALVSPVISAGETASFAELGNMVSDAEYDEQIPMDGKDISADDENSGTGDAPVDMPLVEEDTMAIDDGAISNEKAVGQGYLRNHFRKSK